jgi:TIR domain-containing protein
MKMFISWSGPRSQALAQALHDWTPLVLHYIEPWLSETDVTAGARWAEALGKELENSNFGIICVTRENIASPWILFEAGSLAKSLQGSRVIPLLLDLDFGDITGPLAQFQAKKVGEDGLRETIQSINVAATEQIPEPRVRQLFNALWPQLEKQLKAIPTQPVTEKPIRNQPEILEELVSGVRSLEARIRHVEDMPSSDPSRSDYRRPAWSSVHISKILELARMLSERPGDPLFLLFLISFWREEFPWLYSLGLEVYRALRAGTREEETRGLLRQLQRAIEYMAHSSFSEELFGLDSHEFFQMTFFELDRFAHELF